jgi:hypothetical protein
MNGHYMKLRLNLRRFMPRMLSRREPEVPASSNLLRDGVSSEHMFVSVVLAPGDQFRVVALRLRHANGRGKSMRPKASP